MKLIILSDLHLKSRRDPLLERLELNLLPYLQPGDRLVLAGDIFDLYIGNRTPFRVEHQGFLQNLRALVQKGIQIDFIEGNHDLYMNRVFPHGSGVRVRTESVELGMGGKNFYIAHGDLVDRTDYGYLALRWILRSWPLRIFSRAAPKSWIQWIGDRLKTKSSDSRQGPVPKDVSRLRRVYRNFAVEKITRGFDYVILGHCHDLDEMSFAVGSREGHYKNMGYPPIHGSYLLWSESTGVLARKSLHSPLHSEISAAWIKEPPLS